jgi:predicted lipid carrier protein YhbT
LIRFAVANNWGRRRGRPTNISAAPAVNSFCARYIEQVFPRQAQSSRLARTAKLNLVVSFDIAGPGGGQWSCRWTQGELAYVNRGLEEAAEVCYQTDTATFQSLLNGRQSPQQAFFDQRITVTGNLETALKLAHLFDQFLQENPVTSNNRMEAMDAVTL